MKSLLIIGAALVISGVGGVSYVNAAINHDVAQFRLDSISEPVNPQQTAGSYVLQPKNYNPQADQTGGNGQDYGLQPALGYNALTWQVKDLKVE